MYIDRDPHFWNSVPEKGNKAVDYTFDIYLWNLVYKGVVQKGIKQRRSLSFVNAYNPPLYQFGLPPVFAFTRTFGNQGITYLDPEKPTEKNTQPREGYLIECLERPLWE